MNISKQLIAITTGIVFFNTANVAQAFTVISGEDINDDIYIKKGIYYSYNNESQELEALSQLENKAENAESDFLTHVSTEGIEDFETYYFDGDKNSLSLPGWLPREGESASSTFSLDLKEDVYAISFYLDGFGSCGELEINLYNDEVLVGKINNTTNSLYTENESGCQTDYKHFEGTEGYAKAREYYNEDDWTDYFEPASSKVFIGIRGDLTANDTLEKFNRVEFVTKGKSVQYKESHLSLENLRIGNVRESTNIFPD